MQNEEQNQKQSREVVDYKTNLVYACIAIFAFFNDVSTVRWTGFLHSRE